MPTITAREAIRQAIAEEMRRDPSVFMLGEGVATTRPDLVKEFGSSRVRNTPLSEAIIAGTAVGAAASGLRPIVDLLYSPFLCYAMDQIVNSAGKLRYMSGGQFSFPLVTMVHTGSGWSLGAQHNHNNEAWFVHSPGLKVVMPHRPADYKGLLKAAVRDENPVMFFMDMTDLDRPGEVPDDSDFVVPLGKARLLKAGSDVSLISYSKAVGACLEAAEALRLHGVEADVLDLRSLKPLDEEAIASSAVKTGRVVIVHEASRICGVGAEVAAIVAERCFDALKAPISRIASPDAPVPSSPSLERAFIPSSGQIAAVALRALGMANVESRA